MTTTPLPSYGIWTTDMEGKRVMGFTPEQFLSVWQARADLEAENQRLREALKTVQAAIYMDDAGQLRLTKSFDESVIDAALGKQP